MSVFDWIESGARWVGDQVSDIAGGIFGGSGQGFSSELGRQIGGVGNILAQQAIASRTPWIPGQMGKQCFPGFGGGEICVGAGTQVQTTPVQASRNRPRDADTAYWEDAIGKYPYPYKPGSITPSSSRITAGAIPGQTAPAPRPPTSRDKVLGLAPRGVGGKTFGSGPESTLVAQASPGAIWTGVKTALGNPWVQGGLGVLAHEGIDYLQGLAGADLPAVSGGQTMATLPGGAQSPGGMSMVGQPYGGSVFQTRPTGPRARHTLQIPNPYTGQIMFYQNMGRPILFSGDLRAAKRVRKAASRARRGR